MPVGPDSFPVALVAAVATVAVVFGSRPRAQGFRNGPRSDGVGRATGHGSARLTRGPRLRGHPVELLGMHFRRAVRVYRGWYPRTGPAYVLADTRLEGSGGHVGKNAGGNAGKNAVHPVPRENTRPTRADTRSSHPFDRTALYLWVDRDGRVVDAGAWESIFAPLVHGGVVATL